MEPQSAPGGTDRLGVNDIHQVIDRERSSQLPADPGNGGQLLHPAAKRAVCLRRQAQAFDGGTQLRPSCGDNLCVVLIEVFDLAAAEQQLTDGVAAHGNGNDQR